MFVESRPSVYSLLLSLLEGSSPLGVSTAINRSKPILFVLNIFLELLYSRFGLFECSGDSALIGLDTDLALDNLMSPSLLLRDETSAHSCMFHAEL